MGYAPGVFYSLTAREWNAALRAHSDGGDGHDRTHTILAQMAALFETYINIRAGSKKTIEAAAYLPWRDDDCEGQEDIDAKIKERLRQIKKNHGS